MTDDNPTWWRAAVIALILVCLTFPDVVFKGASLRVTDQMVGAEQHLPLHSVYPSIFHRQWWESYTDHGGSLYQSDPMTEFMRYCLWSHNSPYWNPYSGAGQFGPETLVDQKFSVFTLLNAVLGGGTKVYNITLLFFYFLGTYFIYRIARMRLRLSPIAGIAMCVFYLLNGYIVANTSSNVSLNYFLVPMCLYTSLTFLENVRATWFVSVILSYVTLLSYTFFPTTIGSVISIYVISIGYVYVLRRRAVLITSSQIVMRFGLHLSAVFLAGCLLAFLYLPIIESLTNSGVLGMYHRRVLIPAHWQGIFSLFSPSHFFESYAAMAGDAWPVIGNVVFHFGVVALSLMACALGKWRQEKAPLTLSCMVLVFLVLSRIFGVPGVSLIFSIIPIIGNLGCQYWWSAIVFPMLILVGLGVDNLENRAVSRILLLIIMGIGFFVGLGILFTYGIHAPFVTYKICSLISLVILALVVTVLIFKAGQKKNLKSRQLIAISLTLFMFLELTMDTKFMHYQTNDIFAKPAVEINYIKSRIGLYRTMTIGNMYGIMHGVRPELGSAYQIQEITSMNAGGIQNYVRYFHKAVFLANNPADPMFSSLIYMEDKPEINKIDWAALNLLGVKYIILPGYFINYPEVFLKQGLHLVYENSMVKIFDNPNVIPRAFGIVLPERQNEQNITLPLDFYSKMNVVDIKLYRNTEVKLDGYADKPMLVVLTDNWQKNWKASVNDIVVPIMRVNGTFRGVWVSPGHYKIMMYYRPSTLIPGIIISFVVLIGILSLLFFRRKADSYFNKIVNLAI